MAATVKDLAILHSAMSGPDPSDYVSMTQPPVHLAKYSDIQDLKDLRVGVYSRYFDDADPEIVNTCRAALEELKKRGATIVEIELPHLQVMDRAHKITIMTEFAHSLKSFMGKHLTTLGDDAQVRSIPFPHTRIASSFSS
jgi:aspartyl-tRNA(Asn)/glutamyl-tRNA(Gln) amidotransferase subunit A